MATLRVPVSPNDHIQGAEHALVTMVEYGDYQCPYCAAAFPVVNSVLKHFGTRLRLVFRHFPLTEIHPLAKPAAETAEFAGAHGHFWKMHDILYENHDQLGLPLMLAAARTLGLSEQDLESSLANETYAPKVQADFLGGVRSGVNGTPAFYIQGVRHDGSYDYESLTFAINAVMGVGV